jgi:hypothetical protein
LSFQVLDRTLTPGATPELGKVVLKMKTTIGDSLIPKLKPKAKQYEIRDTKLKGFLIRVNPSGKMTYICQYKRGKRINIYILN